MPRLSHRLARLAMHCYPFPRGDGRIVDSTPFGRLQFQEHTLLVPTAHGFAMKVFPNDHIGRHIYLTGRFDHTIVELLLKFGRRGDRFVDIGANIGYVSCALLALLPDCRVVAVEPQPHCFELLRENLSRLAHDRSLAVCVAVSDRDGTAELEICPKNTGASGLVASDGGKLTTAPRIPVSLLTGERLIREAALDRVQLIKIDVEGHELPVLKSLRSVIDRYRPRAIVFEHSEGLTDPDQAIGQLFSELGYRILGLQKHLITFALVPIEAVGASRFHDYVAVPRDQWRSAGH